MNHPEKNKKLISSKRHGVKRRKTKSLQQRWERSRGITRVVTATCQLGLGMRRGKVIFRKINQQT